jgi:4-hydroxy-tetrahydrodipicolinate synthase
MLAPGVYPASVTPMTDDGRVDLPCLVRLLALFESQGCRGAVIAGTNGEGPSLGAIEKRDMARAAVAGRGNLDIVLGIATPSLEDAQWLASQASKAGVAALLVMAPSYFREATPDGIRRWFLELMDSVDARFVVYNFPQRTGIALDAATMGRLAEHDRMIGLKDSSGDPANLPAYAEALRGTGKGLFVGNETLLWDALEAGWTGTISGAANVLGRWLVQVIAEREQDPDAARAKFELVRRALEKLRGAPQPETNKALLHRIGVLPTPALRLPLTRGSDEAVDAVQGPIEALLGPLG